MRCNIHSNTKVHGFWGHDIFSLQIEESDKTEPKWALYGKFWKLYAVMPPQPTKVLLNWNEYIS
jgi:hypothetical protein